MDKELLEAIGQMMEAQEKRLDQKLAEAETRIMKGAAVLMDAEFTKHFKVLLEQQEAVLSHVANEDDLDIMDSRIEALEKVSHKHTREIAALKKAN